MMDANERAGWTASLPACAVAVALTVAILAIAVFAPTEETMGHAQRILYVHVAVAWWGLVSFLLMAGCGAAYLVRRDLGWDWWAQAAAEVGWLAATLTLATGSLWARAAWNTWWTWDPRLTTVFILWAIYGGTLVVRSAIEDPHQRARTGAVLAIIGAADLPLVVMATRWFRTIHPPSPQMEPSMRLVLLASVVGFSALLALLLILRRGQIRLAATLDRLEQFVENEGS